MKNAASYYNQCRHHVFSTFNMSGTEKAYECLYSYKAKMLYPAWIGLKVEHDFYTRHKDEYVLASSDTKLFG